MASCTTAASRSASAPERRSTSTSSATAGPRPTCAWRCSRRPSRSSACSGRAAQQSHHGRHYTVENARVYDQLRRAAADPRLRLRPQGDPSSRRGSATASARRRRTRTRSELYRSERREGPGPRRHQGLLHGRRGDGAARPSCACGPTRACPASSPRSSPPRRTSSRPASSSPREHIASPVGPDLDKHAESLQQYADAGVDELFVQQIGPDQDSFFTTWADKVLPRFT